MFRNKVQQVLGVANRSLLLWPFHSASETQERKHATARQQPLQPLSNFVVLNGREISQLRVLHLGPATLRVSQPFQNFLFNYSLFPNEDDVSHSASQFIYVLPGSVDAGSLVIFRTWQGHTVL